MCRGTIYYCTVCVHVFMCFLSLQLLLRFNASLFAMNVAKQTPLDSAVAAKQIIIAPILESQMVLSVSY